MKRKYIFTIVSLLLILGLFQNCGGVGFVPGQKIDGFQSNGGGYSGVGSELVRREPISNENPSTSQPDDIEINNGCSGKIQVYQLLGEACELLGLTQNEFEDMLVDVSIQLQGQDQAFPTESEAVCKEFQEDYVFVLSACEEKLTVVPRSSLSFESTAGQIIIENEFYKPYGLFNIKR